MGYRPKSNESSEDIEKIFHMEEREKRRGGLGTFSNSGRRGGGTQGIRGSLNMPNQWLKGQNKEEYKKYISGSVVKVSNVFEELANIPTVKELELKDFNSAQSIVKAAREYHTTKELSKHWATSGYGLYKIFDKFGVEYNKRGPRVKKNVTKKTNNDYLNAPAYVPTKKEIATEKEKEVKSENAKNEFLDKQATILENSKHLQEQNMVQYSNSTPLYATTNYPTTTYQTHSIAYVQTKLAPETDEEEIQYRIVKNSMTGTEVKSRITNHMNSVIEGKKYKIKFILTELPDEEGKEVEVKMEAKEKVEEKIENLQDLLDDKKTTKFENFNN